MNNTPQPKSQKELQDELQKRHVLAHKMWLNDPTTQQFIAILKMRGTQYENTLFARVLVDTDLSFQATHRGAITTCAAILKIVTDSDTFIEQQVKQQQTDKV